MNRIRTVEEYISQHPDEIQKILWEIHNLIKRKAPDAVESIAYQMPAYKTNGKPLIYFSCFKNHIGLYATPSGHLKFKDQLSKYKQGKGSVQFPLDKPIPFNLIGQIVEFRVSENQLKRGNKL
jgi:uncharacterized protein YdhG (YjbR/CyaY superfamily)